MNKKAAGLCGKHGSLVLLGGVLLVRGIDDSIVVRADSIAGSG